MISTNFTKEQLTNMFDSMLVFVAVATAMLLVKKTFMSSQWDEVCCISIAFACGRYFLLVQSDVGDEEDEDVDV